MTAIRLRATVWFATGVAMTLLAGMFVANAWMASAAPSASGCSNVSLPSPVRVLDTRDVVSEPAGPNVGLAGPIESNKSYKLQVTGPISRGALGTETVIPLGASSVDFNVTVLRNTAGGFVSVRPGDATGVPGTSSENVPANSAGSNNFGAVGLTSTGNIDLYYGSAAGAKTELIIDVVRYCATDTTATTTTTTEPGSTTTTTTTMAPLPINVTEQSWHIDWQGNQPGVASEAPNRYTQVRFGVTDNKVSDAEPSDNGNPSDGGNKSLARGGDVCKDTNIINVEDGKFQSTAPYDPIGTPSVWEFYNLTCNSDASLITGNYRRTDGGNTDTGILQMYKQGTNMSPLPDPVVPPLATAQAGPTCDTSHDLPDTTRKFEFTGAVPGKYPSPDTKISVNFEVEDGKVTSQSSVQHDGTNSPYTWGKGQILCGARVLNVLMTNNTSNKPAASDPGKGTYRFVNVRVDGVDLIGDYGYDMDDNGIYEDVGTFRTQ